MENSHLLEYIGKTKTQKLQNEITKEYFEIFYKKYPNFTENHKMNSLVTVTKDLEIKKIGMSCINDLINDNWAKFIGTFLSGAISVQPPAVDLQNTTNNALFFYNTVNQFNHTNGVGDVGSMIQIGSGNTPATRQDFNIETAFVGGSEALRTPTGLGAWITGIGQIKIPMQLMTLGAGSITETILLGNWETISPVENQFYLITRDNISPAVSFIGGESVNVDYTMVFT